MGSRRGDFGDGASPGKIFVGGLAKDTTLETFVKYFEKYGQLTDSVIMKDRMTGKARGFGFVTYADPAVVDVMIEETHVINGKQVEIKRTIPKGAAQTNDFKTKKIFVGGLPASVTEDDFKDFFSEYGTVVEHEIIMDHATKRSRGFGFIVFDDEKIVEKVLSNGNMIDMAGSKVEIKKAEPKKPLNPAPGPARGSEYRTRSYMDGFSGHCETYSGFSGGPVGLGAAPYRSLGGFSNRCNDYGGYVGGEFGGSYGGIASSAGTRGEPFSYPNQAGSYGGGYGGSGYGSGRLGSFGHGIGGGAGYGGFPPPGPGSAYDTGLGPSYGGVGGYYGSRGGGYGGGSRYHPYSR